MSYTEHARFNFKVRRGGGDRPFIYLEPLNGGLSILNPSNNFLGNAANYRFIGFNLADGVGWDEAEQIAELLNEKIASVGVTELIDAGH